MTYCSASHKNRIAEIMTPKRIPVKRVRFHGAGDLIYSLQEWNELGGWRGLVKDGVLQIRNVIEVIDDTMTELEFLMLPDWEG